MIGAIIGDIAGSRFEFSNTRTKKFELLTNDCFFTDDTVCTVAVADAFMHGLDYAECVAGWCKSFPGRGYGGMFARWINNPTPYNSFGNGAVMRISALPMLIHDLDSTLEETKKATAISHDHPDGIKYAQAVAACIFNLRNGIPKDRAIEIAMSEIDLDYLPEIAPFSNPFDETVYNCVPAALHCLQKGTDFCSTIREAIIIGGDVDTIGACVGGMAEALYGVPDRLRLKAMEFLPENMKLILDDFQKLKLI